jgi:capsid protein
MAGGGSGGQGWPGGLSSNGSSPVINHTKSLANGRSAFHDSAQARAIVTRARDITVDDGLKLEPTPAWDILGETNEEKQDKWVAAVEQGFDLYMKSKFCHRSKKMTGYQLQRQYALYHFRDNDQFVRFYYNKSQDLPSKVQIAFIDPNQIVGSDFTDTMGLVDLSFQNGIAYDGADEEIAYKVRVKKRTKTGIRYETVIVPARGARSKRIFMIHGFNTEYAGQGRGYSPLHFAVQALENITDFQSAQIKKAINQSGFVGFTKPAEDQAASNIFESLETEPGPQTGDQVASVTDSGDDFVLSFNPIPELTNRVPGSNYISNLDKGETIEFPKDTAPGPQFDAFITSIMSYLASAYGWPIEVVLMKFGQNYSASRAALLLAWQKSRIEQAEIDADFMAPWYEMWLSEEIAAGRIQAPGWSDPRLRQAWLGHILQGPPLPHISPRDDLAAIKDQLDLSLTTQDKAARQINSSSAKANQLKNTKMFPKTPVGPWAGGTADTEPDPAPAPKPGAGSSDNE